MRQSPLKTGRDAPPHVVVLSVHPLFDTRIANHLRAIVDAGWRVTYINWSCLADEMPGDLRNKIQLIHRSETPIVGLSPRRYLRLLNWFGRHIRACPADVYHIHDPVLMPLMRRLRGRKFVFDIHEHYTKFPGFRGMLYRLYFRLYLPCAAAVVATSPTQIPRSELPSTVVPNYQDRRQFAPFGRQADNSPGNVAVTYFGNMFTEDRDVACMLDAAERVLAQREDVVFRFGGVLQGPDAAALHDRMARLRQQLAGRFEWLGVMAREDVIEQTAKADVGLWILARASMNASGCSPNKIYEYLTVGAAIIATDGFVDSDEVRQSGAGVLLPIGVDAQTLAQAILSVTADRAALASMKAASAELGRQFTWESVSGRYLELYQQIMTSPSA